jgi:hypothetical protein
LTEEQIIVLGFLAAAFVAGWLARTLIARRDRPDAAGPGSAVAVSEEDLRQAVEATRRELDRAVRSHVAAVALSVRAREGAPPELPEPPEPDPLAEEVSAALQDDAANETMLSVMDVGRDQALSERELDLTDWGFAYGVAWARARERVPSGPQETVAREALRVADSVFRAYAADARWAEGRPEGNGRTGPPRSGS